MKIYLLILVVWIICSSSSNIRAFPQYGFSNDRSNNPLIRYYHRPQYGYLANQMFSNASYSLRKGIQDCVHSDPFPHFVSGIVAGVMECLVGHPLDTIRVRLMSGNPLRVPAKIETNLRDISALSSSKILNNVRNELHKNLHSLADLYKGYQSELLSAAVGGCIVFGVTHFCQIAYENVMSHRLYNSSSLSKPKMDGISVPPYRHVGMITGALFSGFLDGITSKPFEMVKLRQQMNHNSGGFASMSFQRCWNCIRQEGSSASLFRGWLPTVLRESIGNLAFFVTYEYVKEKTLKWRSSKIEQLHQRNHTTPYSAAVAKSWLLSNDSIYLLAGSLAGLSYVLTSHPFEITCILMQTDVPTLVSPWKYRYKYSNMVDCMKDIVYQSPLKSTSTSNIIHPWVRGMSSLYRGSGTTILRAIPSYAASFWGYEITLKWIQKHAKSIRLISREEEIARNISWKSSL